MLAKVGVQPSDQILRYKGRVVDDGALAICCVSLHLTLPACCLPSAPAAATIAYQGGSVFCTNTSRIIPSSNTFVFTPHKDERALDFERKTLALTAHKPCRALSLGIGAGGMIEQHIERDETENPRIWDVASSKILNVQLLDSRTFRLVTGLQPPDTPVGPETYAAMGLPFYKLDRDEANREVGVAAEAGGVFTSLAAPLVVAAKNYLGGGGGSKQQQDQHHQPMASGALLDGPVAPFGAGGDDEYNEPDVELPVALLDVDDTIPAFRSIVEQEEEDFCEGFTADEN